MKKMQKTMRWLERRQPERYGKRNKSAPVPAGQRGGDRLVINKMACAISSVPKPDRVDRHF